MAGWHRGASPTLALVRRELLMQLRRTRWFILVAVVVGAAALATHEVWPSGFIPQYYRNGLAGTIGELCLSVAVLLIPGSACLRMLGERQRDTLDMLRMSGLTPGRIVFGKVLSSVLGVWLLLVSVMPMIAMLISLPGFQLGTMLQLLCFCLLLSVLCGCAGVACGAWIRRPVRAVALVYGLIIGALVLTNPALELGDKLKRAWILPWLEAWFSYEEAWSHRPWWGFGFGCVYFCGLTATFWWMAVRGLRVRDMGSFAAAPRGFRARGRGVLRQAFGWVGRLRSRLRRGRFVVPDGMNPYLARELHGSVLGTRTVMVLQFLIFGGVLGGLMGWGVMSELKDIDLFLGAMYGLEVILVLLTLTVVVGTLLPGEAEGGILDDIRLVPGSAAEFFNGKVLSAMLRVAPVGLSVLFAQGVGCVLLYQRELWSQVHVMSAMTLSLITDTACTFVVCMFVATFVRQYVSSFAACAAGVFVFHLGPQWLNMFFWMPSLDAVLSPPAVSVWFLAEDKFSWRSHDSTVAPTQFWIEWCLHGGIYCTLAFLLWQWTRYSFELRYMAEGPGWMLRGKRQGEVS